MAMEVASGVVGEAAKSCFALAMAKIKKEWSYIWHYNDNMNDLREKRAELETLKRQIEGEVEARERKREMIGPLADEMLRDVEAFLANDEWSAFMDENKIKKKDKCCFSVLHCNLTYRYRISKRATTRFEITKAKIKKMEDCKSRAVTLPGKPPELGSMPTAHSKSLASRESTLNEIMEALKDKKVHRIGIYGMGGIGKTTLIEEVARRAEAEGLFKVVIAEVSQAPDILKMQQQIAERIDLSLEGLKSEAERARVIYEALKKQNHKEEDKRPKQQNLKEKDNHKEEKEDNKMSKKRTTQALVILDNMWKKLDLDKVGIPHDCKIALTTRSEDVCREMEANKKFGLQGLNDTEATELFLERARPSADHDDGYKSVTDELVKKCGGLPLAIVALANTLRDRNLSDWKHVANQLGKTVSARVGGPMEENVHPILEWSYNSISNKEKKKFFLLCCLFPPGSSIAIRDLTRYGAGLDLFKYMNSLGEAIEQAHSWATELKSSSLLLEAEDEQDIRIHDIVREASISIATKGDNVYHIGSFPQWLTKETFQTYTTISMTSEDNHEPLSRFEFPKLEMLLLKGCLESKFSENFFQAMKSLKVLVISGMKFEKLPSSITTLNNLRTLHLEHCELSNISAIASLVDLLFLSLHESEIDELPKELEKLGNLKLLDLTKCRKLRKIPAGLIVRLTNLEGLYMMDSFLQWHPNNFESSSKKDELYDNKEMASLIELKSLSSLTVLEMHVPKIYLLPHNLLFPHLSRFSISIGYKSPHCDNIHSKLLFLGEIDAGRPLQQCITFLLKETEHLSLERISGLKNVVNSLDKDGFRNLKCLFVEGCSDMEYIVTGNELNEDGGAFPKLETLTLKGKMDNLKVICHGSPSHYSFHHLKVLKLYKLRGLRNFYDDHDMYSNQPFFNEKMKFPSLEELKIEDVDGIVELWNLSNVEEEDSVFPKLVNLSLQDLPELRSIWRSKDIIIHGSFKSLKSLEVYYCPKLEILCPFSVVEAFKQLETLDIYGNENMKEIIAKETEEMKNNNTEMTIFPNLQNIGLWNLFNLKYFFGGRIKFIFPSLKSIDCRDLNKMVAFVSSEYPGDSGALFNEKVKFPGLEELRISNVGGGIKELWNLSDVEEEVSTFPRLVHLEVEDMHDMWSIWMSNDVIIHHIFQNLKNLTVRWCSKLKILCPLSVAVVLTQLDTLIVEYNYIMEEIIAKEIGGMKNNDTEMTILPKLQNIELQSLPNLKCFFGGSIKLVFPSLKSINCKDLNKMVAFVSPEDSSVLFNDKVKFPSLEELRIFNVGGINELWNLSYVEEEVPTFPRLVHLEVDSLPKIKSIWMSNDVIIHHIFQNLKSLTVRRCPNLKILCPLSVAAVLKQLDTLIVESNENMKEIIAKETGAMKNNDTGMTILPKLQNIVLQSLSNLKCFFSGSIKLVFPSLKSINCKNLDKIVAFVSSGDSGALFNDKMKFPSLEELKIERMGGIVGLWTLSDAEEEVPAFPRLVNLTLDNLPELRSIWRSNDIVIHRSSRSLKSLKVSHCPELETLCPFSVAEAFEQLETLEVMYNKSMKEIIAKKTGELKNNDTGMTVFAKLRNMELHSLSNLKCFFGGNIKLVFPSLESINFSNLGKMVTFVSSKYPRDSDALFNDKVALPAIKEIYMRDVNGTKAIWGSHLDAGSFNKLESLVVFPGPKEVTKVFSLDAIRQMQNLKELYLKDFRLAEEFIERIVFYNDGIESSALLLPQLRELEIRLFPLLKRIPWRDLAFQNLRSLKIYDVKGLTYLFPASVGKRFAQLEELQVNNCQKMGEIVAKESGDTNIAEVEIVFPHLNILRLCDLPALRSLSPDNVIIEFPSIIEAAFVRTQKSIPLDLLQKLHHVKEVELEGCEIPLVLFDLQGRASTILPRLGALTLSSMNYYLQMIPWKIFPIENLHYLLISRIDGLKFLFPASLGSKGFTQLEEIYIRDCTGIEHVLAPESIEDTSNNPAPIKVVLPRVKFIQLRGLQSLRSFSSDNYKDLKFPSLEEVQINECPTVETFSYGSLNTPRLRKISINGISEYKHLDLNAVIKNRMEEKKMSKDTETKFTEGETSQGIEEDEMSKDAETKFIEGETSQGIKEKKMSKDAETKFTEGETSQGIEEDEMSKDAETKFTEGEISQGVEEETSEEDTWWRRKFEVYDQYFENWTELFGLILYPLLKALVIILMIWIFIRAFQIDADPNTKSKANSNPLFKGNEL